MRNVIQVSIALFFLLLMWSCSGNNAGDPKMVAKSFFEALSKKDFEKAAQYATKDSKTMLDLIKSLSQFGADAEGNLLVEEKVNEATYSDAILDGDKAIVKVTVEGETNTIKLIKEEGMWKVALDKETLEETAAEKTGMTQDELNAQMEDAMMDIESFSTDSIRAAIQMAGDEIKNDSLRKALQKAGEVMKKAGEAMQEAAKEKQ